MSVPVAIKTEEVILDNAEYNSTEELDEELQLQLEDSGGESYKIEYQNEVNVTTTTTTTQPQSRQRHQQNSNMNQSGTAAAAATATAKSVAGGGGGGATTVGGGTATSNNNKSALENEKRIRREIANSNERRRMQSINAGFQNLRSLLPRNEGEKLSKAAILQQTSQYICELENQKTQLLAQNSQLKRQLGQHEAGNGGIGGGGGGGGGGGDIAANGESTAALGGVAIKKRKLTDNVVNIQTISDSSDEGLGSMSPEPMTLLNATTAGSGGASVANTKAQMLLAQNAAKELLDMKKQLDKERRLRTMLEEELQTIKRQLYSVATAPQPTAASAVVDANSASATTTTTYIPREVIEHTGNLIREDCEEFSYVEIDELTGQQQVVVCSSIEELENEAAAAAAEIITEDNVHEEVILSSTSSTESEQEVAVNAIAKAYAEGSSPTPAMLQPILQAAIKATPKVEVERINETTIMKVKTEKIEQPSGLTRSRQNLETIVEAIRHLEGDHLFTDGADQHKLAVAQQQVGVSGRVQQDAPLALTTKQHAQRKTLAELRPYLQLKGGGAGSKQVTIVGGGGAALTLTTKSALSNAQQGQKDKGSGGGGGSSSSSGGGGGSTTTAATVTPTAIFKVQTTSNTNAAGGSTNGNVAPAQHVTITTTALKQCRPGVIVAKQLS